jgi:hypothetical protein
MGRARRWLCRLCGSKRGCHPPIRAIVQPRVGTSPPHACKGHEVVRGRCHWGRRWHRAPLLVLGGDFFPETPESVLTGEMVEVPARMPAHSRASTPSRGGREGIRTGVSGRPEANRRIASFLYYSYHRKGNNTIKPSTATCGMSLSLCQAGERRNGNAASPPLIVGDSRYSPAELKARRPPTPNTLKSVKRARNLSVLGEKKEKK